MKAIFTYHGPERRCTIGEHELHCGETFTLLSEARPIPVRIEHSRDWYLVGAYPQSAASFWDGAEVSKNEA